MPAENSETLPAVDPREAARVVRTKSGMTVMGTLITFFPAVVFLLAALSFGWFVVRPGPLPVLSLVFVLYLLPVIAYRLHNRRFPLREGGGRIVGSGYSPWYGGHQIQVIYLSFPALETVLRLVPGLYSAWLRLWGSKVGRQIYWTPRVEIVDRGLVESGDRVVFGHGCGLLSHAITPTKGNLFLFIRRVKVGDGAFVGAGSYLGPGVILDPGAMVPAATHVYPKKRVRA